MTQVWPPYLRKTIEIGALVWVCRVEEYSSRKIGDEGEVLAIDLAHVRVRFNDKIETMRWDSLAEVIDFTPRIRALLAKRKQTLDAHNPFT